MNRQGRRGYTLIELLIVIGMIAVLAALTIAFFPNAASSAKEARAAQQVQGWLNVAKQRALRDQAPRGVRFWLSSATFGPYTIANVSVESQYLESPEDFSGGAIVNNIPANIAAGYPYTLNSTVFFSADLVNGDTTGNSTLWSVQPGDALEVLGSGLMHQVVQVGVPLKNGATDYRYAVVLPPLPYPIANATPSYRIVRSPRPVGDETLKMPDGTCVDFNTNFDAGNFGAFVSPVPLVMNTANNPVAVDIVFAPSGTVITRGVTGDKIHLWVRAPDQTPSAPAAPLAYYRGSPSLVSVFVRTGFVGAYDPVQLPGNPYALVF